MKFWKYSSAGNDFVVLDEEFKSNPQEISDLCDRRFGIGADGVLVFKNSSTHDFEMVYYNSDGGEVEMCGNGARALCHYARYVKNIDKTTLKFKTLSSTYEAKFLKPNLIKMAMSEIKTPNMNLDKLCTHQSAYIEVGVPHVILLDADYDEELAKKIRWDKRFLSGVNVNFLKKVNEETYKIHTFERGVEAQTLACGTGITAAGVYLSELAVSDSFSVTIKAAGGDFIVEKKGGTFYLTGTTHAIFSGELSNKE